MAEITDVLSKLLERTQEGKVQWQPTSNELTFVAVVGNLSVMILSDAYGVNLRILDKSGNDIETIHSGDQTTTRPDTAQLTQLYVEARRTALNVGSQLDELLKELG